MQYFSVYGLQIDACNTADNYQNLEKKIRWFIFRSASPLYAGPSSRAV